jgi:hypothetical protein
MKKQLKLSKVAKVATGVAFLSFCLLNLKTVINNNGKVEMSNSNEAHAIIDNCWDNPPYNDGDCNIHGNYYLCDDSWIFHDCRVLD